MSLIDPLHERGCACPICTAERKIMVQSTNPLMKKEIKPTRTIIPVDQAIAQVQEAIDVYEEKLGQLYAEMKILRDE
ncbi:hypothetical protein M0R72_15840 [Candidatus Pacearchaeota archaeon]|nr:hypothetical protein [Candidatus Pacearchaeota archaeon]